MIFNVSGKKVTCNEGDIKTYPEEYSKAKALANKVFDKIIEDIDGEEVGMCTIFVNQSSNEIKARYKNSIYSGNVLFSNILRYDISVVKDSANWSADGMTATLNGISYDLLSKWALIGIKKALLGKRLKRVAVFRNGREVVTGIRNIPNQEAVVSLMSKLEENNKNVHIIAYKDIKPFNAQYIMAQNPECITFANELLEVTYEDGEASITGGEIMDRFLFLLNHNVETYLSLMERAKIGWASEGKYEYTLPAEYTLYGFSKEYGSDLSAMVEGMKKVAMNVNDAEKMEIEGEEKERKRKFYENPIFEDISRIVKTYQNLNLDEDEAEIIEDLKKVMGKYHNRISK